MEFPIEKVMPILPSFSNLIRFLPSNEQFAEYNHYQLQTQIDLSEKKLRSKNQTSLPSFSQIFYPITSDKISILKQQSLSKQELEQAKHLESKYIQNSSDQNLLIKNTIDNSKFMCKWKQCWEHFQTKTGVAMHCMKHVLFFIEANNSASTRNGVGIICLWDECKDVFENINQLMNHLECHIGQKLLVINPKFDWINDSNKKTEKEKKFTCELCGKKFADRSNKKKHEKTHDKIRERFHCHEGTCKKSYLTRSDLRFHIKCVHLGERPYRCSCCNKGFIRKEALHVHERKHDNILLFECSCGKGFHQKKQLKEHLDNSTLNCLPSY